MRAGDIIFVQGSSPISRLVRLFDKGKFSHVAIAVSETHVIETNWNMKSKIVEFHYEDFELVRLQLSDNQRKIVPAVALKYEGKWYDYLQIISYIFQSRLNNPRHLICSELVYNILSEVGYVEDGLSIDVTPNELYKILNR